MSAILKFDFQERKQFHFSEVKLSKLHKKEPILQVATTFSLKQGETRTSHGPIPHPLMSYRSALLPDVRGIPDLIFVLNSNGDAILSSEMSHIVRSWHQCDESGGGGGGGTPQIYTLHHINKATILEKKSWDTWPTLLQLSQCSRL